MEQLFKQLIKDLGDDPSRPGVEKTPARAARAYRYITSGYHQKIEDIVNNAIFESESDEMIIVKNIELYSMCEHHLLPFIGKCHVAYLPDKKVLGLSKIARIVDIFARRMQIQENLTTQIGATIQKYTEAVGVGVVIEAQHLCMMMRGVEKQNSVMTTSCMLGAFRKKASTRAEFLNLINK
ncbi:MAG TPA: GTP cyclohydrolase I FolE [Spirochaetota bacterium]|nr:GTP cyclohydrolase I FolE [Spirochaetota bacterium]